MIIFFNSFDLFQAPFITSIGYNGFQHCGIIDFIKIEIKVNLQSMRIVVISKNFPSDVIQLIEIFCLKFYKIYLNKLSETIVLDIHCLVSINLVYNILVKWIVVSFLNFKVRSKNNFKIMKLWVIQKYTFNT